MKTLSGKKYLLSGALLLTALLALFPLFFNLSFLPIRLFDESRLANNALEMSNNYNFLVTHYKGEPDMWSTKPPLMIWFQVACIWVIGAGELAIRLPSAISGLFILLITGWFVRRVSDSNVWAVCTVLVLTATAGFITEHGTRSGDYDTLLVLFLSASAYSYFLFLQNPERKLFFSLTVAFVVLAVYTKGIAGLLFLPGLLVYTIYKGRLKNILFSSATWKASGGAMLLIAFYYLFREWNNPKYLLVVYQNEIYSRYFEVNEGHEGPWNFYINYLKDVAYSVWYLPALGGILMEAFSKKSMFRDITVFAAVQSILFLLLISKSETKIEWYALPLFPMMAILAGAFFYRLYQWLGNPDLKYAAAMKYLPLIAFLILFVKAYSAVAAYVLHPKEKENEMAVYNLSYIFQDGIREKENLNNMSYVYPAYNAHLHFYTEIIASRGQHVKVVDITALKPGDRVLVGSTQLSEQIQQSFKTKLLKTFPRGVQLFSISE